jgi:hypothetical protein
MAKYVIAKDMNRDVWCAYRVYFGLWDIHTYVHGTASLVNAGECEEQLIRKLNADKKIKIKEIEL